MGVDVAGGHARHSQPPRQLREPAVARPVLAQERPLELDPQALGPEHLSQPSQGRLVVDPAQRAPAQADQPLASRTSRGRWRPSSRSISAPWIGRRPNARAETANSIEPDTVLWSVR